MGLNTSVYLENEEASEMHRNNVEDVAIDYLNN